MSKAPGSPPITNKFTVIQLSVERPVLIIVAKVHQKKLLFFKLFIVISIISGVIEFFKAGGGSIKISIRASNYNEFAG